MPKHLAFGGGAGASTMSPAVVVLVVISAALLMVLPRKYSAFPMLIVAFLVPYGQELMVGGVHFYAIRVIAISALCRLTATRLYSKKRIFPHGFNGIDIAYCLFVVTSGTAFILRERAAGAVVYQIALWLEVSGLYLMMRYQLQGTDDILRLFKTLVVIAAILGSCMLYEYNTRVDLFGYLAGHQIIPWMRYGRVRAQAGFANSITAGVFGATLIPLFVALWKSADAKIWATVGLVFATIITITSMASTPITGYLAGILALICWPLRRRMRSIRWGIVLLVIALALAMKAPVWFLLARVNIAGGNAYDRAVLVDQTIRHFSEWWLVGTDHNAKWGFFTWDACNQFVAVGISGGLVSLALFIVVLSRSFSTLGKCRRHATSFRDGWLFWCLGACLFSHAIVFLGVDYFDQTRALWVIMLATFASATLREYPTSRMKVSLIQHRVPSPEFDQVAARQTPKSVGGGAGVIRRLKPSEDRRRRIDIREKQHWKELNNAVLKQH